MWPLKLDMTRDESRGMLRRLELDTYSSVMSTFRAQGALCKEKARILEELRKLLHISQDRHKAEARRVANDERLTTVAEIISGPNSTQDWSREGRRTFPILPRTAPYTALSYIANTVCEQITRENSKLPHPFETSQNRLQKEQQQEEERKQKLLQLEQQTKQEAQKAAAAAVVPIEIKEELDEPVVAGPPPPAVAMPVVEPASNAVHPPVVTADPFVEAANKSYINNDLKRSYPVEPVPALSSPVPIDDDSPLRKKPQLYQELQKQEPLMAPQSPIVTFHQQFPPQQIPVGQGPMSPHKNLTSPNNFGMTPVPMPPNMNNTNINININNNNFNPKPVQARNSNKNTERPRKTSVSKKNQNKTKTPYQTNKQAGGKANKNSIAQQQLQQAQMMPGGPNVAPGKGHKGNNSANSPHLIHSYASPLLPYEIPQQQPQLVGATAEISNEPLQLQKHLTSNAVYQPNQQTQQYGMTPIKSAPYTGSYQQSMASMPASMQHQILPSSKKDIQYNLTKLNPTHSSSASMKNNVNIPLKQSGGSSSIMQGKGHPLFNYQKKSPSKNVLIPTSSAAAALASLGIPKNIQPRKDVPKFREPDPSVNPADIPNPKIIFSTSHHQEPPAIAPKSSGSQITILDQITLHPPHTIVPSTSVGTGLTITPSQSIVPVTHITPAAVPSSPGTSPLAGGKVITPPVGTIPANKLVTIKGPNLAGFTPVKSGSKLSVHKLQLMPISSQPGGTKNNVIVLPAKGGTLNPGQKITIPRSVVDPSTIISPPKVIVQQQPDLNNIVLLDLASEQNKLKTTTQPKSVITEDTPVDIVSTPLDVVTGAVKLQELKGFLSPASSSGTSTTASPLTEKMVKPQQPNNSNASKATKFEADSTAPGPSVVPIPKKTKANHQPRGSTSVAALSKKTKATTAAASSTTPAGREPTSASTARNPAMSSSTDWELELDQANQATNSKPTPNPPPKVTQKSTARSTVATLPVTTPIPKSTSATPSTIPINKKAQPQPLSSSSISSTSSNASSPVVVEQQAVSSDVVVMPQRIATQQHQQRAPPPVTPVGQKIALPAALTTSPPNERSSDDTSATDSANAEEDPDPEYPAFREATSESDDDYEHFNAVIEEDPDPEDAEDIHGERVEIVNVGYDTSRALIADLEDTSGGIPTTATAAMVVEEDDRNGGGGGSGCGPGTINPSSMNFVQYIEEADVGVGELVVDANGGGAVEESTSGGAANGTRNITFEMVEIDSEGNKHTRTMSYEEALAEGNIMTEEDVKGGSSSGSSSGGGLVKGKTKSNS